MTRSAAGMVVTQVGAVSGAVSPPTSPLYTAVAAGAAEPYVIVADEPVTVAVPLLTTTVMKLLSGEALLLAEHQILLLQTPQPWRQVLHLQQMLQLVLSLGPMLRQALQYLPCSALRPGLRIVLGLGRQRIDRFRLDTKAFWDSRLEHLPPGAEIVLSDPACEL